MKNQGRVEKKLNQIGLRSYTYANEKISPSTRSRNFARFISRLKESKQHFYYRKVITPMDREVLVWDEYSGKKQRMLMFGSNNYLGLANHPYVKEKAKEAIEAYGAGVGGPPLLNGYSSLMEELEERLAAFKHQEAAIIFPTGSAANLGLIPALAQKDDLVLVDALHHASFFDSLRMTKAKSLRFKHNDLVDLERRLREADQSKGNVFVGVEGVYSMDGDIGPLDGVAALCQKYGAFCMVDDAHGTGVLGTQGGGTAEYFGIKNGIDISMGTFSKAFAVTGGFLAGSYDIINYLRYYARTYMFSAALPPMTLAAILAGLDLMEKEPERRSHVLANAAYARERLQAFTFAAEPGAAILALSIPEWLDHRKATYKLHTMGIFLNPIEFPAVPSGKERFRISLMASHTREDIDRLVECLEEVWWDEDCRK